MEYSENHWPALQAAFKDNRFFIIAGPCAVESESMTFEIARRLKEITRSLDIPFLFKASYKKANRSSIHSFTGIGDEKALQILSDVKKELNIPVITDIHSVEEAGLAANFVDVLQIPAFLCRQTDLLVAAARTKRPVMIKKGQFMSPASMRFAVDKIRQSGNDQVGLIERGTCFGYNDLVVDFRGIPDMRAFGVPVVMDCTHSLQQPNQPSGVTGGIPHHIKTIALAAVAVGVDGLFFETHPAPETARSDGANMLPLDQVEALLKDILRIRNALSSTAP